MAFAKPKYRFLNILNYLKKLAYLNKHKENKMKSKSKKQKRGCDPHETKTNCTKIVFCGCNIYFL